MTIWTVVAVGAFVAAAVSWWQLRDRLRRERAQNRETLETLAAVHDKALTEHAQRLQAVLDSMVEGIVVLDQHNYVVLANRAAAGFFGFVAPATGRALLETVRHHEISNLTSRLKQEKTIVGHEFRIEGSPSRFLQVNAAGLNDSNGDLSGGVLVFHDLTRLRELEGVRQEFVANVSHELRTPLSLIKGATETLLDGAKTDAVALERMLTIIDRHANRLTLLIDDLLLMAKLDSDAVKLVIEAIALRPAVQEVVDDLMPHAQKRSVSVENAVPAGLIIRVDPDRLRQVLWNLIDNAIKYGRPAGIVKVSGRVLNDEFVEGCVEDDGPGIPSEARGRVFERFYRADKARSREQGGTGLGLSIVKHVVQVHGGDVRVESEIGHGASFYFTLPR